MDNKQIDLCCVGHITRDRIITPKNDVYMDGGVSFYFANALRHLPPTVSFCLVTKLAQEHRAAAQRMIDNGIDVRVGDSKDTVFFVNIYGENPDERSQKVLAKSDAFTLSDMENVDARFYHLGSLMADDFSKEFIAELSKRGKISLDAQGFLREVRGEEVFACDWQDKFDILRHTSILKVNETEAETITGIADPLEAAKMISSWGVEEVVMTLGSHGSLIYAGGMEHRIPAIAPCKVVDSTGCGDTFMAAYLYQRAAGKDIPEAGLFAAAVCSIKLEHTGPFEGTMDDIIKRTTAK